MKQKDELVNDTAFGSGKIVEYHDKTGWPSTEATANQNTWTYLVGKRDGNKQYLYANGVFVIGQHKYFINYGSASRNTSGRSHHRRLMDP